MLRRLVAGNRTFACILLAAALAIKALVPAGFMLEAAPNAIFVTVCSDASGEHSLTKIAVPMKEQAPDEHDAAKKACPFSTMATPAIASADTVLLAAALVFILALGFAPAPSLRPEGRYYLRPPLRGPPAAA